MNFKKNWKRFWTLSRAREGFTLVELIVVIAIMAILAGVAVPAYTGYIKKAEKASDLQLLGAVNTAFAAAAMDEGQVVASSLPDGSVTFNMTAPYSVSQYNDAFQKYFAGNTGKFKVITSVTFKGGVFVEATGAYAALVETLREKYGDAIADAVETSLGKIGTEELFKQMNGAMDMAGELNLHTLSGMPFMEAVYGYLGIELPGDSASDEELLATQEKLDAKLAELDVDFETVQTNAIALYAAQNSADLTIDRLNGWLGKDKTTDDMQASPSANTLAEAAAIYGMYLSYYKETNGTTPEGSTLDVMADALADKDGNFTEWVNTSPNAQSELDAYKTYMGILNDASKDDTARDEILANGFKNDELEGLMKDLMGN